MANLGRIDPRTYAGLFAWYDANAVNGLGAAQPAADATVGQWNDLSGNGHHLVQATGADRPLFRVTGGLNQLPCVEVVDSTDNMAAVTASAGARPQTVIAVWANKLADDGASHRVLTFNSLQIGVALQWTGSTDAFSAVDSPSSIISAVAADLNVWHISSYTARTLGSLSEVTVDGVNTTTAGVTGTDINQTVNLSVSGAGGVLALFGELLVYATDLPRTLRNSLESSLAEKWGFLPRYGLRG